MIYCTRIYINNGECSNNRIIPIIEYIILPKNPHGLNMNIIKLLHPIIRKINANNIKTDSMIYRNIFKIFFVN